MLVENQYNVYYHKQFPTVDVSTQWGFFKKNENLIGGDAYIVNYPISNNKTWIVLSAFFSSFEYKKIISKVYSIWESSCEITTDETIEANKNTQIGLFIIGKG